MSGSRCWVPVDIDPASGRVVEMAMSSADLIEGVLGQTAERLSGSEGRGARVRDLGDFVREHGAFDPTAEVPVLVLANPGRCGSTVLQAALGTVPGVVAVGESDALSAALALAASAESGAERAFGVRLVRAVVRCLLGLRSSADQLLVVRLTGPDSCRLDILVEALDHLVVCLVWRDPLEVVSAHLGAPARSLPGRLGLIGGGQVVGVAQSSTGPEPSGTSAVGVLSRELASVRDGFAAHGRGSGLVLTFQEVLSQPEECVRSVLNALGRSTGAEWSLPSRWQDQERKGRLGHERTRPAPARLRRRSRLGLDEPNLVDITDPDEPCTG